MMTRERRAKSSKAQRGKAWPGQGSGHHDVEEKDNKDNQLVAGASTLHPSSIDRIILNLSQRYS